MITDKQAKPVEWYTPTIKELARGLRAISTHKFCEKYITEAQCLRVAANKLEELAKHAPLKPGWTLEFLAGYVAGLREAVRLLPGGEMAYFDGKEVVNQHSNPDARAILARAQELDPK